MVERISEFEAIQEQKIQDTLDLKIEELRSIILSKISDLYTKKKRNSVKMRIICFYQAKRMALTKVADSLSRKSYLQMNKIID